MKAGLIKKTPRQKLIARLDALHREYIRRRAMTRCGGCERCGAGKTSYKQLDTAHCHGRGRYVVRWDPRNSAGICGGCHRTIDSQITAKEELFRRLLGDEYDQLYVLAQMTSKQSAVDYGLIELYLRTLLNELNSEGECP